MSRIDQDTVNRILDATDIVDVVSDFVKLKRRGANYIGLCPFHNDRTPSFSVSKAKGLCKCFSCGKGGSAIGFLMELEQLSYVDALKYLAKKYNIEIKEHEMTDAEIEAKTHRESMLAINKFALDQFEHNLIDDPDGQTIGLPYFRERGISDLAIKRFHLGYSLDRRDALLNSAKQQGFNEKYLIETGLCIKNDRGQVYDRFKGRVIYPIFSISGKVVGFGGRTLRSDKSIAKYVNSPESTIYSKSNELYGLYQAKQSIVKKNKCILVEGYMDVISMSQSGIDNVVASSGTALTDGQIRLIHRFTENVTVIYDSDAAGIKASLRGIDMLLAEGMKIKVLLLPQGEDPDSFAQSHTTEEVEQYISDHETDFIRFKTHILLEGVENDPIKRSEVITDIVKSISVIPDNITRTVYIGECSRLLNIDETVLKLEVEKATARQRETYKYNEPQSQRKETPVVQDLTVDSKNAEVKTNTADILLDNCERELLKYAIKYGATTLCDAIDENGDPIPMSVLEYISEELNIDNIDWINPLHKKIFSDALKLFHQSWIADKERHLMKIQEEREEIWNNGVANIKATAANMADIKKQEISLKEKCDQFIIDQMNNFSNDYLDLRLASSPDPAIRQLTVDLVSERHQLSKVHTKYSHIETEQDRLVDLVPKAIASVKDAHLAIMLKRQKELLSKLDTTAVDYTTQLSAILKNIDKYTRLRMDLARDLGERVIVPRR